MVGMHDSVVCKRFHEKKRILSLQECTFPLFLLLFPLVCVCVCVVVVVIAVHISSYFLGFPLSFVQVRARTCVMV